MIPTLEVKEDSDTGELYLELSDDILSKLGWKVGDNIEWTKDNNNQWILKRV